MAPRVLMVVGDLAPGKTAAQLGAALIEQGAVVTTVPEKLSRSKVPGLVGRVPDEVLEGLCTETDVFNYLDALGRDRPHALVLGLSSPRERGSLEAMFERVALDFPSIRLVFIEDVEGALERSTVPAEASLVLAPSAPRAGFLNAAGIHSVAAGTIAAPRLPIVIPAEELRILEALRSSAPGGRLVFFSTYGSDGFLEQLTLLRGCLEASPACAVLYSIHPKKRDSLDPAVQAEVRARRADFAEHLGGCGIEITIDSTYAASFADVTFAGGASPLVVAAHGGKISVACATPGTLRFRVAETGTDALEVVRERAATQIDRPCDLFCLPAASAEARARLSGPFNPHLAANAVMQLLLSRAD